MRTAGRPLVNTTSCHFPSLGAGLATKGGSGAGTGLCGTAAALAVSCSPAAVGMPPASDPPAFGLLSWYWACSSRVTAQFRPRSASWAALNPRHALAETTNAFPGKDNRGCDTVRVPHRKGTCLVVTVAPRRPRIEFRADDPTLTPNGGLALVAETCRVLDVIGTIERHVGPIKARRRGAGAGELLVGLAECMLAGGDFFTDLDPMRADVAGAQLRAVAEPPASTTAVGLGRRFGPDQLAGLRAAQAELIDRQVAALPRERRRDLLAVRPTIDLDPTDVEVYGERKERIGWSYAGVRAGRPVPLVWAESGLVLTGTLLAGDQDVRPHAPA